MEEKFGRNDSDSSDMDNDGDDEGGDGGDAGAGAASAPVTAGASTAGAAGDTSAGNDEEDTESDDNPPELGYEVYFDERGVKRLGSTQGTSSVTIEEIQQLDSSSFIESSMPGTSSVPSTADLALKVVHPVTGEILEE
ncbi:hypothetical protein Hanom_Chr01g00030451 [Helianthus anomalus]